MSAKWMRVHLRDFLFLMVSGLFLALAIGGHARPVDFESRQAELAPIWTKLDLAIEKIKMAERAKGVGQIRLFAATPDEILRLQERLIKDGGAPKDFRLHPDYAYDIILPATGGTFLQVLPSPAALARCRSPGWLLTALIPDFCGVVPGIWQSFQTVIGKSGGAWKLRPMESLGKAK